MLNNNLHKYKTRFSLQKNNFKKQLLSDSLSKLITGSVTQKTTFSNFFKLFIIKNL